MMATSKDSTFAGLRGRKALRGEGKAKYPGLNCGCMSALLSILILLSPAADASVTFQRSDGRASVGSGSCPSSGFGSTCNSCGATTPAFPNDARSMSDSQGCASTVQNGGSGGGNGNFSLDAFEVDGNLTAITLTASGNSSATAGPPGNDPFSCRPSGGQGSAEAEVFFRVEAPVTVTVTGNTGAGGTNAIATIQLRRNFARIFMSCSSTQVLLDGAPLPCITPGVEDFGPFPATVVLEPGNYSFFVNVGNAVTAFDNESCGPGGASGSASVNATITFSREIQPGACCEGDVCSERTQPECAARGGDFLGEGTTCAGADCETLQWSNPGGGDFSTAENWTPPRTPEHGSERSDTVVFGLGGQYPVNATGARAGRMIVRNGIVDILGDARLFAASLDAPSLVVGDNGVLNVVGGTLESVHASLGESSFGRGDVSVLNEGTRWENSGRLLVGDGGPAKLSVVNGEASALETRIGGGALAGGEVVVGGATALLRGGNTAVGFGGPGLLDIRDGGTVQSRDAFIGRAVDGTHEVLVGGLGPDEKRSLWFITEGLVIGDGGKGALRITEGGFVTVEKDVEMGAGSSIRMDGASLFGMENFSAGHGVAAKSGEVETEILLFNGAEFFVRSVLTLGTDVPVNMAVVQSKVGVITNEAVVGEVVIADSSNAILGVLGADARLNTGNLTVGRDGVGLLNIISRATVKSASVTVGGGTPGVTPGVATSVVLIDNNLQLYPEDDVPSWAVERNLFIGRATPGLVRVENGGKMDVQELIVVGEQSDGFLVVVGEGANAETPSLLTVGGSVLVGLGEGIRSIMSVEAGGLVGLDGSLTIAGADRSTGTVQLFGSRSNDIGSTVFVGQSTGSSGGEVSVGRGGVGKLNIFEGCGVRAFSLLIAPGVGGTGSVSVEGPGNANGDEEVLQLDLETVLFVAKDEDMSPGGTGELSLTSGARVRAVSILVGSTGAVRGNGTLIAAPGFPIRVEGVLEPGLASSASIETVEGGTGSVKRSKAEGPGTLTISGDLVLEPGAELKIGVQGPGPGKSDRLEVLGDFSADGTLVIQFQSGYLPLVGHQFEVIDVTGQTTGEFTSVLFPGVAPGFAFDMDLSGSGLIITAQNDAQPVEDEEGEGEGDPEGEPEGAEEGEPDPDPVPPVGCAGCGGCDAKSGPFEKALGDWIAAFLGLTVLIGTQLHFRRRMA